MIALLAFTITSVSASGEVIKGTAGFETGSTEDGVAGEVKTEEERLVVKRSPLPPLKKLPLKKLPLKKLPFKKVKLLKKQGGDSIENFLASVSA